MQDLHVVCRAYDSVTSESSPRLFPVLLTLSASMRLLLASRILQRLDVCGYGATALNTVGEELIWWHSVSVSERKDLH